MATKPPRTESQTTTAFTSTFDPGQFNKGLAQGRGAATTLLDGLPFDESQRAWFAGFLMGLMEAIPRGTVEQSQQSQSPTEVVTQPGTTPQRYSRETTHSPYASRIAGIEQISIGSEQSLLRVILDIEGGGLEHRPGDMLAVWPTNDPDEVRKVLRTLGVGAQSLVRTRRGEEPAWRVLLEQVDIEQCPRESLALLAERARSREEALGLIELSNAPSPVPARSLLALLRRYPSARPNLHDLLTQLSPLTPSRVPIASSGPRDPTRLEFVAKIQDEPAAWGRLPTSYEARLRVGEWLSVTIDDSHRLPELGRGFESTIFIVDELGLSLVHSFLAETHVQKDLGRTWLIACTGSSTQFPYRNELLEYHRVGRLRRSNSTRAASSDAIIELLATVQDTFWSWLVDHSRIIISISDPHLQQAFKQWITELLEQRSRLTTTQAKDKQAQLELDGQLRWWPPLKPHTQDNSPIASQDD